jgi:hypothetical protein
VAIDLTWSGRKSGRDTPNSRMSNFQSDIDCLSLDPLGSFRAVDLRDPPLTTRLTGNVSWNDMWPLLVTLQVLTIELGPLDEGICGK